MKSSIQAMILLLLCFQIVFFGAVYFSNPLYAKDLDRWAVGVGVAVISDNNYMAALTGDFKVADEDSGGWIYNINLGYILTEINLTTNSKTYTPRLEIVSSLGIVDENNSDQFYNVNTAVAVRWIDFPWNKYVSTTFMMGVGLNYSQEIFRIDREKHPNDNRSHLKFFWPAELSVACPGYEHHRLVFFNHHISGGHIMDVGGLDFFGVGYQYLFH